MARTAAYRGNRAKRFTRGRRARKSKPLTPPATTKLRPISALRSSKELSDLASGQVDTELSGQISPLESQLGSTQSREARALQETRDMFGHMQPYVADAARRTQETYDQSRQAEEEIFRQAGERLNSVKQDAAAEAQALAQKIGGPVAVGDFTGAVDPSVAAFPAEKGGAMLHALGMANAGVQEANAWSGRVFPLIQTEKTAKVRQGFEDQIKTLEDHIAQLKGTRSSAINSRYNDLLTSERTYQLQKAQSDLEKLKTNRDWQATVHTLKNDDKRLGLAGQQFGLQEAGVTGAYKGKATLAARKLTSDQRLAAQKLGLSNQQFYARLAATQEGLQIQRSRVRLQAQKNAMQMIDSMINPASGKPITLTTKHFIPKGSPESAAAQLGALSGKRKDVHWDSKKKQWYFYQRDSLPASEWAQKHTGGTAITDAKQIYNFLLNSGIPKKLARQLVKTRTGKDPLAAPPPAPYAGPH